MSLSLSLSLSLSDTHMVVYRTPSTVKIKKKRNEIFFFFFPEALFLSQDEAIWGHSFIRSMSSTGLAVNATLFYPILET
jgi:hypothetical protein